MWSIDRFEGNFALCEGDDGTRLSVRRGLLPPQAREGDLLRRTESGYEIDPGETARRRADNAARLARLAGRPPRPDILDAEEKHR